MERYTPYTSDSEKHDLLFRFIQYAERQVVLFDALEDAAFTQLNKPAMALNASIDGNRQPSLAVDKDAAATTPQEVRLVLTAHPTQFYTGAVLGIISDLSEALKKDQPQQINALPTPTRPNAFFSTKRSQPHSTKR